MKEKLLIRKKKLYEEVIESMTGLLKSGEYKVGDRLPSVQELSEMFGVGKPTLREALSVLASSGVLEIRHGNGIFVKRLPVEPQDFLPKLSEVDIESLLFWLEFRRAIEVEAAGLAAERREDEDLEAMEAAERQVEEEAAQGRVTADTDYRFHHCIALATHNPVFIQSAATIAHILQEYWRLSLSHARGLPWHRELVSEEHRKIIEGIRRRRPREARQAMLEHINNVEKRVRLLERLIKGEEEQ
ncbi:MAG: FadR/GntR family transcriptional regulator [Moorellaceae bacterium]